MITMKTQDEIRTFKSNMFIDFIERGENFTLDVPHYNKWLALIYFLKKRGFTITANPYFEKGATCLSKYHKIGHKKDIVCLMEINAASIHLIFGHIKNLWKEQTNFWDWPSDTRYTKLDYMETMALNLEIAKTIEHLQTRYKMPLRVQDKVLPPEETIIDNLKTNTHIHGVVNCLNDIKLAITETNYNYLYNSDDKNKKKLICGDKKYFYDYVTKRLACGIVWHHINNMWWVISGNKLHNIYCGDFFDYDPSLPRRQPIDVDKANRLLKRFEGKKEYLRCDAFVKHHKHLFEKEDARKEAATKEAVAA